MSSSAPCAPSNSSDSPRARASGAAPATSATIGAISRASASVSSRRLLERHGLRLEVLRQHEVVELEQPLQLGGEAIGVEQVLHPQRAARDLVLVGGADAAPGRADLAASPMPRPRAPGRARRGTEGPAGRRARSTGAAARSTPAPSSSRISCQQRRRRQHDAVADAAPRRPGRRTPEGISRSTVLRPPMTSVWPALWPPWKRTTPCALLGQPVDDLALALIAPLGADDDDVLAHADRDREGSESPEVTVRPATQAPAASVTRCNCRRSSVKPVAGRARPNAWPMPS